MIANPDPPAISRDSPAQDFDQGGFPGAVLSQKNVDLPLIEVKVHVIQGMDAREALINLLHPQERTLFFRHRSLAMDSLRGVATVHAEHRTGGVGHPVAG
jgi:hypothetical protein